MADTYIGVNNVAKKTTGIYIGVNNIAKKVTSAYIGVNNVAKLVYAPSSAGNELCFTALQSNSGVMLGAGSGTLTKIKMETKKNNQSWSAYTLGTTITLTNVGDKVYFRSATDNDYSEIGGSAWLQFGMSGSIAASGSVMSLYDGTGLTAIIPIDRAFYELFKDCDVLTTPPELNATTIKKYCYSYMFSGCTNLTIAPNLPAINIPQAAYMHMFVNCTSIINPPTIAGTIMSGENGCAYMFDGCSSLTSTPVFNFTTMANNGCQYMFQNCTSITTLPRLKATTLALTCYQRMFIGCPQLSAYSSSSAEHSTEWRIPITGTGSSAYNVANGFFDTNSAGIKSPSINTTYYTGHRLV